MKRGRRRERKNSIRINMYIIQRYNWLNDWRPRRGSMTERPSDTTLENLKFENNFILFTITFNGNINYTYKYKWMTAKRECWGLFLFGSLLESKRIATRERWCSLRHHHHHQPSYSYIICIYVTRQVHKLMMELTIISYVPFPIFPQIYKRYK